jgi:fluoroacetyl-CoA thioesterase
VIVGITHQTQHTVTREFTTDHLSVAVLSTPGMIGLVEATCLTAVAPYLRERETTVGTHVCVSHEASVREGERFTIRCRLASIEKRRLTFEVEVLGQKGRVSRGTHQRAIVNVDRMGRRRDDGGP